MHDKPDTSAKESSPRNSAHADPRLHEICGAIHLHTTYSDGGVNYDELIGAAQNMGLHYLVVTDHMSMGGAEAGYEGFHGNLCVIVGYEHNDMHNRNHYLAIGTNRVHIEHSEARAYVESIHREGAIGFLAHPAEKRDYFGKLPPYPWTDWSIRDFDGIEIWNQMSDWVEHLRSWTSFIRLLFPRRFMGNAPADLLKRWDNLNRTRFVSGIGGVDAHTRRLGSGLVYVTVFPIKVELQGIRTHLYLRKPLPHTDPLSSKRSIMEALSGGHGFVSNFRRGDAFGTRIYAVDNRGSIRLPGRPQTSQSVPATIIVELPGSAEIHLMKNGTRSQSHAGARAEFAVDSHGVYRIEAHRKSKAWIYSNPFPFGSYPV